MVGGAWLLWHAQRLVTSDVDSARRLDPQLTDAIGRRYDLRSGWLNDAAAAFWPAGTSFDDCAVVYEEESLVVRAPPPGVVCRHEALPRRPAGPGGHGSAGPMCGFVSPEDAVEAFEPACPHAPEDEHLVDYVREIAEDASGG